MYRKERKKESREERSKRKIKRKREGVKIIEDLHWDSANVRIFNEDDQLANTIFFLYPLDGREFE